jgi:hypothetical protein
MSAMLRQPWLRLFGGKPDHVPEWRAPFARGTWYQRTGFLLLQAGRAEAQSCCGAPPTTQATTPGGPDAAYNTATDFSVLISGGAGNFSGWTVGEYTGAQGEDSCWGPNVNPQLVPQFPMVSETQQAISTNNTFQDRVGWLPTSVTYIRANAPPKVNPVVIPVFPCGFQLNQAPWIECPGSTAPVWGSTVLTASVYSTYVFNCRQDKCAFIYK